MTAKLSSSLYQPTARGRTRMLALATAVAIAISAALGASTSRADVGSVYFDANGNAAAGETFGFTDPMFTGGFNVGLGRSVMPNLTDAFGNVAVGDDALAANTDGDANVATGEFALSSNTTGSNNVATGTEALAPTRPAISISRAVPAP